MCTELLTASDSEGALQFPPGGKRLCGLLRALQFPPGGKRLCGLLRALQFPPGGKRLWAALSISFSPGWKETLWAGKTFGGRHCRVLFTAYSNRIIAYSVFFSLPATAMLLVSANQKRAGLFKTELSLSDEDRSAAFIEILRCHPWI